MQFTHSFIRLLVCQWKRQQHHTKHKRVVILLIQPIWHSVFFSLILLSCATIFPYMGLLMIYVWSRINEFLCDYFYMNAKHSITHQGKATKDTDIECKRENREYEKKNEIKVDRKKNFYERVMSFFYMESNIYASKIMWLATKKANERAKGAKNGAHQKPPPSTHPSHTLLSTKFIQQLLKRICSCMYVWP